MTFDQGKLIGGEETADEYGRREDCFRNYRQHPFTLQSYITELQSTKESTESNGLVAQLGLKAGALPNPNITEDAFDWHQNHQKNVERFLQESPSRFTLPTADSRIKELLIPVDGLDLGSCLKSDLQEYLRLVWAKRFSNPFEQWLPLACTRSERDESLNFPPVLNRLWALLHREIETDFPIISDVAADLVREVDRSLTASEYKDLLIQQTRITPCQYSCIDLISPPLSPVSDDAVPFIPDRDVAVIDLVSEPSSPGQASIEAILRDMDSEPIISSTFMTSSPARELPQLLQTRHAMIQEAKADLPVVLTSSDALSEENLLTDICLPLIGDLEEDAPNLLEERGHFEDAFMTLLEDRQYYANKWVNQERLDPADCISRIPVPLLDFDIQPPEWMVQRSTAKMHFTFLRNSLPSTFSISPLPRDPRLELSVTYSVFPLEKGQPIMEEEPDILDGTVTKYLSRDPTSHLSSMDFVSIKPELDILCIIEDEEIEEVYIPEEAYIPDDMVDEISSTVTIEQYENPNHINSLQGSRSAYFQSPDSPILNRPLRRKLDDDSMRFLPKSYDTSATSILLHNFMELRGIKRPRLDTKSETCQPTGSILSKSINEAQLRNSYEESPPMIAEEMVLATAPTFEMPSEKAYFIISVDLSRPILRRLENVWSPENLIDMDYSQYTAMSRPLDAAQPKEVVSELGFEADISLSPRAGIIITNILKVRQRPLPGSRSQTALRERVQTVSQKYEALIVLVSESHPSGEFSGTLSSSDIAAYADFVSFTVALDGDVNVHLVPGAEETMASWVLAFMSRHCHQSESLNRYLSSEETAWELFFRRVGMNVIAAKVLSKTLFEQAGPSGLAVFLMMPVQERVARYGPLLGEEKVLRLTAKALDRRWGQ
ncbi:hypothetical protein ACHAQJ_003758 [Trichoderma viride]